MKLPFLSAMAVVALLDACEPDVESQVDADATVAGDAGDIDASKQPAARSSGKKRAQQQLR